MRILMLGLDAAGKTSMFLSSSFLLALVREDCRGQGQTKVETIQKMDMGLGPSRKIHSGDGCTLGRRSGSFASKDGRDLFTFHPHSFNLSSLPLHLVFLPLRIPVTISGRHKLTFSDIV